MKGNYLIKAFQFLILIGRHKNVWICFVQWPTRAVQKYPLQYKYIYPCTKIFIPGQIFFFVHTSSVKLQDDVWKKKFSTFSYKPSTNFSYHDFGKFWCIFTALVAGFPSSTN